MCWVGCLHVVRHPTCASELVSHPPPLVWLTTLLTRAFRLAMAVSLTGRRWTVLGIRSVNEECSGLVVLSGTSLSNLAALFAMTPESMGVQSIGVLYWYARPGQPSSADLLNCSEQGNAVLLWPVKLLCEGFPVYKELSPAVSTDHRQSTCSNMVLAAVSPNESPWASLLAGGDGGENVDVHRKISRDTQLITNEVGYELK